MSDYHLHLHPHRPTPGAPPMGTYPAGYIDRFVEVAMSRGVSEVGFTEHLYRCVESEAVLGRWWERDRDPRLVEEMTGWLGGQRDLSLERYVEVVLDAKARGLPVKLGLEVDFVPGTEQAVLELLSDIPFDYLIGSIHWIDAWNFMRDTAPDEMRRRGVRRAFEQYFALETALAGSGLVDALAHVDVIKRHAVLPQGDLESLWQPVVEAAARSGIAVEVSSAGLRAPVAETFPAPALLSRFRHAGVPILLASDAHVPDDAAAGYDAVVAAARHAGYTEYLRFTARRSIRTPLPEVGGDATDRDPAGPAILAPG